MTSYQYFRNLMGLAACVVLLSTLLGGCATARAQMCLGAPPMCLYPSVAVCHCPPSKPCVYLCIASPKALCECTTDIDCETKCGGEY